MSSPSTISSIPVEVHLSFNTAISSNLGSAIIHITIKNLSPDPISILRWSTLLDAHAAAIGVFTFTSTRTNTVAPCLNLKFNHQLPALGYFTPDDENIVNLPANGQIERDLKFKEPEVALMQGEKYSVTTQGSWTAVWIHGKDSSERTNLSLEDAGLRRGGFESNEIVIEIPEYDGGA